MGNPENITVLSLCTGYGGIELGMSRVLANPLRVVAVEVEAYALANLVAKAEAGKLAIEALWPDLKTFPAERFRGCFDFITAGYPCQGESTAGKRQGEKDPRWLWPHIERIIEAIEPVWCLFENVPGHLSIGYPTVYRSLQCLGYKVEAGLFTAAEVGAPHKRQRLFILAHRPDSGRKAMQGQQAGQPALKLRGKRLADAERAGPRRGVIEKAPAGSGRDRFAIDGSELADANNTKLQGWQSEQTNHALQFTAFAGGSCLWPARPGRPQYKWEEPRVVVNAGRRRCEQSAGKVQTGRDAADSSGGKIMGDTGITKPAGLSDNERQTGKGQAESRLGRAVNGSGRRVDRLRLLGNGVMPQQEEKALRYLLNKHGN